nr:GAF domain-containing protein [Micromonospora sp. DSM 115978]
MPTTSNERLRSGIDRLLVETTVRLRHCTDVDLAMVGRVEPHSQELTILCVEGARTHALVGLTMGPGVGVGGLAIARGKHVSTVGHQPHANRPHEPDCEFDSDGIRSMLAVPTYFKGKAVAVLYIAERSEVALDGAKSKAVISTARWLERFYAEAAEMKAADRQHEFTVRTRNFFQLDKELSS